MDDAKRFWMVKGTGPTSKTHDTYEAAEAEALRLASKEQGRITILEAVAYAQPVSVPAEVVRLPTPSAESASAAIILGGGSDNCHGGDPEPTPEPGGC